MKLIHLSLLCLAIGSLAVSAQPIAVGPQSTNGLRVACSLFTNDNKLFVSVDIQCSATNLLLLRLPRQLTNCTRVEHIQQGQTNLSGQSFEGFIASSPPATNHTFLRQTIGVRLTSGKFFTLAEFPLSGTPITNQSVVRVEAFAYVLDSNSGYYAPEKVPLVEFSIP